MSEKALGIISANYGAAGFGPLLKNRTLATLPFGARYRMIDFALSNFANAGIHTVGVITPYYYRSLMDHIGAGKPWDLDRNRGGLFIMPGSVYGEDMGKNRFPLKDLIRNRRILVSGDEETVILCDTSCVLNADLKDFIRAHEKSRCRVSFLYKNMRSCPGRCIMGIENGMVKTIEEGDGAEGAVFLGIMAISREYLLKLLEDYAAVDYLDIFTILRLDLGKHRIHAYEFTAYAGLIDTLKDYERVSAELIAQKTAKELFESDKYKQYLTTMSRFHRYSVNNQMLIYMQMPNATHVAGFNKWHDQFGKAFLGQEQFAEWDQQHVADALKVDLQPVRIVEVGPEEIHHT